MVGPLLTDSLKEDGMSVATPSGVVQTVSGVIPSTDLEFTLPHEHLQSDISNYFIEPDEPSAKRADEPVSLQNLHWIRYHHLSNRDNLLLDDEQLAIAEVEQFRDLGGGTIVEVTPINVGRNPEALLRISRATCVHIVMGTGFYIDQSQSPEMQRAETDDTIAQRLLGEITDGFGASGIRAGIIGEIGCSWPLTDAEKTVLRGAALAQQVTGAAVSIHPGHFGEAPLEIVEILTDAGADPHKIIIGHVELTIDHFDRAMRLRLAEIGAISSSIS